METLEAILHMMIFGEGEQLIVTELISIGSFIIQTKLLILIVSIVLAYYVVRWKLAGIGTSEADSSVMLDKLMNAVLIAIIVWKLTPLIENPQMVLTRPLSLLTVTGGTFGIWLGSFAAIIYIYFTVRRSALSPTMIADLLAFGVLIVWTITRGLFWDYGLQTNLPWGISLNDPLYRYHPVNIYAGLIGIGIVIYVWLTGKKRWGTGQVARDIYVLIGFGWFAVTFFKRGEAVFLLTIEQWSWLALAALGLIMPYMGKLIRSKAVEHNKDGKEMSEMVKETSMNHSPEQLRQAERNRKEVREHSASQAVDKKLDGPNRPAE